MTDSRVTVTVDKIVNGGQALAVTPDDGRKMFIWNALPGEIVLVRIIKQKKHFVEAIAEQIISPSSLRTKPRDVNFLASSPWQIMGFEAENDYKRTIALDVFKSEKVDLPSDVEIVSTQPEWHYRNKMEYAFWGDDDGLHLAQFSRGSKGKQIVTGSSLALPEIDVAANRIIDKLNQNKVRASSLKSMVLRCTKESVVVALYVKDKIFPKIDFSDAVDGIRIYYSNPKSPASVPTELLYGQGDLTLQDKLLGRIFKYDVDSFFQVNLPIFEQALYKIKEIASASGLPVVDMYSGVGSIGLSTSEDALLVELDSASASMARLNARSSDQVVESDSAKALDFIKNDKTIIFDPPRAGLHASLVKRCNQEKPKNIIYLSCNPATQARDIKMLEKNYRVKSFRVYNFFPKTPHIETLAELELLN